MREERIMEKKEHSLALKELSILLFVYLYQTFQQPQSAKKV